MYVDEFDEEYRDDELYEFKKKDRPVRPVFLREDLEPREIEKKVMVKQKVATPKWPEAEIQPLKTLGSKAIGNLFDRVDFLKERIDETRENLKIRKKLHEEIIKDIEADIKEKKAIETHISDMDEKRNFKLDISILMREKRQEAVQFWRDILELNTELKELLEEHRLETKILGIFKDLKGVGDARS